MHYFILGIFWLLNLIFAVALLSEGNMWGLVNLVALVYLSYVIGTFVGDDF